MGEFGGIRHEIYLLNFLAEMKVVLVVLIWMELM